MAKGAKKQGMSRSRYSLGVVQFDYVVFQGPFKFSALPPFWK